MHFYYSQKSNLTSDLDSSSDIQQQGVPYRICEYVLAATCFFAIFLFLFVCF